MADVTSLALVQKVIAGLEAKADLLVFLIGVADRTNGAGVWRALFAESHVATCDLLRDAKKQEARYCG